MTVITELSEIIAILEAEIPANPLAPKNLLLRGKLERELAKYFRDLEQAFPYSSIDKLYDKYFTESLNSDMGGVIDRLLSAFDKQLNDTLEDSIAATYKSGGDEMAAWVNKNLLQITKEAIGDASEFEGPPMEQAIKWARAHISKVKLVDGINEETRKQLSNVIADGIKNKRGIQGIKSDIRHKFNWMARGAPSDIKGLTLASRAEMIARTETCNALSAASLDSMNEMGIEGKEWVTAGDPCEICQGNEADGVIPVGQAFSSGDMAPSAHSNCECALAPALLKGEPTEPKPKEPEKPTTKPEGDEWIKTLPEEETEALKSWQGSAQQVRTIQKTGKGTPQFKTMTKNLENALDKSQPYKGKVYRGISDLDSKTYNLIKGQDTFKWDALSSGTFDERIGLSFARGAPDRGGVIFKIANKTGIDISKINPAFAYEKEVLLRKDAIYKVISRQEITPFRGGQKVLEITLKEL